MRSERDRVGGVSDRQNEVCQDVIGLQGMTWADRVMLGKTGCDRDAMQDRGRQSDAKVTGILL